MQAIDKDFYINMKSYCQTPIRKPKRKIQSIEVPVWYECYVDGERIDL